MTEAILLSNADFDSGRVAKLARVTGAYLFRFSDEIGVLIRLFVMKLSIADIGHRVTEPQRHREGERNERRARMDRASLFLSFLLSLFLFVSVALWLCG
jgi:hypothetical protein